MPRCMCGSLADSVLSNTHTHTDISACSPAFGVVRISCSPACQHAGTHASPTPPSLLGSRAASSAPADRSIRRAALLTLSRPMKATRARARTHTHTAGDPPPARSVLRVKCKCWRQIRPRGGPPAPVLALPSRPAPPVMRTANSNATMDHYPPRLPPRPVPRPALPPLCSARTVYREEPSIRVPGARRVGVCLRSWLAPSRAADMLGSEAALAGRGPGSRKYLRPSGGHQVVRSPPRCACVDWNILMRWCSCCRVDAP